MRNVRTEASAIRDTSAGGAPTTTSRPVRPETPTSGAASGIASTGTSAATTLAPPPCGSAETRSIPVSHAEQVDHRGVGQPDRDRRQARVALGERRPDQAYVGHRLAGTQGRGQGAPRGVRCEAGGDRAGREVRAGQVAALEDGSGRQVARGDGHRDPGGRRRGDGVQAGRDRDGGQRGGEQPPTGEHGAAYRPESGGEEVTHASTLGESGPGGPVLHRDQSPVVALAVAAGFDSDFVSVLAAGVDSVFAAVSVEEVVLRLSLR